MIKEIISGREEDASLFLHCMCGKEVIQFYYYKKDAILNEIIGLQYYGQIEEKINLTYNNFQFSENSFYNFVNKLEEFIDSTPAKIERNIFIASIHKTDILHLCKDEDGFYTIGRARNLKEAQDHKYVWDIVFRDPESIEILAKLKELKSIILNNNNNNN